LQNFFHFDTDTAITQKQVYNLNAILPNTIVIKAIYEVPATAHCRFDATTRSYIYKLHTQKDPFLEGRSWYYPFPIDFNLLNQATQTLLNFTHYESFSKKNTSYYQYDSSTYVKPGIKMRMICPVHGEFWQKPELHLNGSGCKKCTAKSGGVGGPGAYTNSMFVKNPELKNKEAYFYVLKLVDLDETNFIKIGITVNFKNRLKRHSKSHPRMVPVYSRRSTLQECLNLEREIKNKYRHLKYTPKINTNSGGLKTESFKMEIMNEFFKIE
jgi:predicted GIY-YIG superfamily endonuclease